MKELVNNFGYRYKISYIHNFRLFHRALIIELYKPHQDPDNHNGYHLYEHESIDE